MIFDSEQFECELLWFNCRINMGIKLLYSVLDMARQTEPQHRYKKFLVKLEEEGGINSGSAF